MFYEGRYRILFIAVDGVYLPIGCLTGNGFSESSEFLETTTRENEGWKTSIPTLQEYSITFEGLQINTFFGSGRDTSKVSYDSLKNLKRSKTLLNWRLATSDLTFVDIGKGYIQDISEDAPIDGNLSFSGTIVGYGKPVSLQPDEVTWDSTAVTFDNTQINF